MDGGLCVHMIPTIGHRNHQNHVENCEQQIASNRVHIRNKIAINRVLFFFLKLRSTENPVTHNFISMSVRV